MSRRAKITANAFIVFVAAGVLATGCSREVLCDLIGADCQNDPPLPPLSETLDVGAYFGNPTLNRWIGRQHGEQIFQPWRAAEQLADGISGIKPECEWMVGTQSVMHAECRILER